MRRVLPPDRLGPRKPWLAGSLLLVVAAFVLLGLGRPVAAFTALIAGFLSVAIAKQAS